MGQGYSSLADRNVGAAGSDISELPDFSYDKSLGSARFLKTIRARWRKGTAVVKIFLKPSPTYSLKKYIKQIEREKELLAGVLNALPYQQIIQTERAGYLIRQNLYSNLYDRISTRPFLEDIEKKWIAFQLLYGMRDCHARGVHHGDIKSENVMVSSWNWVHLVDFAAFKPTYLPEYDPSIYTFFFDTSGKRTCYIAPERFVDAEVGQEGDLTDAMDIFSLGCVIAELFLEGTPLFTLSQLFKYRKGEFDPMATHLLKIGDREIRELIQHMVDVNPEKRLSAQGYLDKWRRKAFPEYFYTFLHEYMTSIIDPISRPLLSMKKKLISEGDHRINTVYNDFDKISSNLGYEQIGIQQKSLPSSHTGVLPVHLDIPSYQRESLEACRRPGTSDDGTLIFLSFVANSLRTTSRTSARLKACDLLLAFAERISDEAKLDRCLPYLIALLGDKSAIVQIAAIRTITQLMELVVVVSPVNAYVFPEYILPKLKEFTVHENSAVRAMLASCLASLADSASRFLNLAQDLRGQGVLPTADPEAEVESAPESTYQALFDIARNDLVIIFQDYATTFLTDQDPSVRRAILTSVTRLCVFFGKQKANDVILSHLNTYLNDRDWMLRCAFFETVVGVATFLGGISLEEYIMPLMVQALTDPEELVVEKVLRSMTSMASIGLFQRSKIWELIDITSRFTMHPNLYIRQASAYFIAAAAKWLSPGDIHCIIIPMIQPYLRGEVMELSTFKLLEYLMASLPRPVLEQAVTWATKPGKSNFWKIPPEQRVFSLGATEEYNIRTSIPEKLAAALLKIPLHDEDEIWFPKLRQKGMTKEDEWKLIVLREYVWRMANSKSRLLEEDPTLSMLNGIISLKELGITPQTIFFDFSKVTPEEIEHVQQKARARPYSVAEVLLDASRTIEDREKRASLQSRPTRRYSNSTIQSKHIITQRTDGMNDESLQTPGPSSAVSIPTVALNGSTTEASTISGSLEDSSLIQQSHTLRHKSSMISLLNRGKDKAAAETATISTNAFGEVDQPFEVPSPASYTSSIRDTERIMHARAHNYDGQDPHVLRLLDNLFEENFPIEMLEFGPAIVSHSKRQPIKRSNGRPSGQTWRPDGNLVAHYGEHVGPCNRVAIAPDHAFFVTASDDGTVKVWDSSRLEKNVASRSRQTHKHAPGAKVKALCIIENHHCFVSAATDGSVHIIRVDYSAGSTSAKYGKLKLVKDYHLPPSEYVVWMEHYKSDTKSILLMATNASNIIGLELRSMKEAYRLQTPLHHGIPTCFCIDRRKIWLVVGTSHGIIDMFDLRFLIRVKAWGLPGMTAIHRIASHPSRGRGKWIFVAGGCGQGEITVWDVEKSQCREVYRAGGGKDSGKGYEAWKVDDEKPEGILGKFAASPLLEPNASSVVDRGVRAIALAQDVTEDSRDSRNSMGFMISAGADRKIRYWNLSHIESSCVVSGLDVEEPKPTFTQSQLTPTLTFNAEKAPQTDNTSASSRVSSKKNRSTGRPPRSTVISMQQQQLLKCHLDSILDVALLEVPYGMCISVDRSGNILIFG